MRRVEREVDGGIDLSMPHSATPTHSPPSSAFLASAAPFTIERFLEGKHLVIWSADVDTDDWRRGSSPEAIVQRAMRRLNAKGRGIILMHDIHSKTAIALPILLRHSRRTAMVVHVVAEGKRPKSVPELTALPTTDGRASPTALTNAPSSAPQNHRIKKRGATDIIQCTRTTQAA